MAAYLCVLGCHFGDENAYSWEQTTEPGWRLTGLMKTQSSDQVEGATVALQAQLGGREGAVPRGDQTPCVPTRQVPMREQQTSSSETQRVTQPRAAGTAGTGSAQASCNSPRS